MSSTAVPLIVCTIRQGIETEMWYLLLRPKRVLLLRSTILILREDTFSFQKSGGVTLEVVDWFVVCLFVGLQSTYDNRR